MKRLNLIGILFLSGSVVLMALVPQEDNPESEQCAEFRRWQSTRTDSWSTTDFILKGCDDLSESRFFALADRFGKGYSNNDSACEDAETYRSYFERAWNDHSSTWRIQFAQAHWANGSPESGFHPQTPDTLHHGIGVKDEYAAAVVIHEVRHHIDPNATEQQVSQWANHAAIYCFDREGEDDDEEDDENGNNGGGGGGNNGGGGGGNNNCHVEVHYDYYHIHLTCGDDDDAEHTVDCDGPIGDPDTVCDLGDITVCPGRTITVEIREEELVCST